MNNGGYSTDKSFELPILNVQFNKLLKPSTAVIQFYQAFTLILLNMLYVIKYIKSLC